VYACVYAFVTSVQLHFHAFQTDLGRSPAEASQLMSILILVGALGAPLFGWIAERTSARAALALVVGGLALTSVMLWTSHSFSAFAVWAVTYGTVNSGVVAILALVFVEMFGARQIGRLMGVAMVFCMGATMLGNYFSASVFDEYHTYLPAWRTFTALMFVALVPVALLSGWRSPATRRLAEGKSAAGSERPTAGR
jgi:MFS family permease